ncbi:hypothetical protein I2492_03335 [Budviciaceae bacterium CWB-B4]|uniref:Uncharacterized protein n=1 Tax=Limnobaculum xujianqingii TaxID=2738837 RepID=A0A9D7AFY5_9GAMM|nr:hypothetical protein [Limnobaculum xujianqingii]MBK5072052.1 hypothetical protein [Limnobaculum xujianqingii]MBK5175361.1 hypothetical protein [Limnobaculum xujianqingii]
MYKFEKSVKYCRSLTKMISDVEIKFIERYQDKQSYKINKKKLRVVINYILANCFNLYLNGESKGIISLNNKLYDSYIENGKKTKSAVSFRYFSKVKDLLIDEGYIEIQCGEFVPNEYCESYIKLTQYIKDNFKNTAGTSRPEFTDNSIILRKNGKDKEFCSNKYVKNILNNIRNLNILFEINTIKYPKKGVNYALRFHRIYNDSFEYGGRFYEQHSQVQSLRSCERLKLLINENEVTEVDFCSLHMALLYDLAEENMLNGFDPYEIDPCQLGLVDNLQTKKQLRSLAKLAILIVINSGKNSKPAITLKRKLEEDKNKNLSEQRYSLIPENIDLTSVIEEIKKRNPKVKKFFNSGIGLVLQRKDSDIANQVIQYFVNKGIVIIPIHDSFIVEKQYENELIEVMKNSYKEVMGNNLNCRVEVK